ncbi:reverse transcriptase domain-containing protein [Tanacetum coccineum]
MFSTTTPENTPMAYCASTSANPNLVISLAFIEANYKALKSLLRDRRRQMCNNDLRTELEYFSKDYDKEREMEPRPEPTRAATPPLRIVSPRIRGRGERTVGFEGAQSRRENRVERNTEGGRPSEEAPRRNGGQALPNNIGGNLPSNGASLNPVGSVTPFVCWIEDYPLPDGLKMPSYIGSYNGKEDPDNFLYLFKGAIRMQKWLMPVACHMFTYTLKDSARIWWNSQKAGSILDYEDLKAKFRSHFSQQKKFMKTHLAVHNNKQREGESTRAFITRYL